ncbi:MAG: hypothetical protein FWH38_06585 [Treponema sp.]|nr:hypothetical protein [Treponema sp.]
MITKTKKSVSLSNSLLRDLALYDKNRNVSFFIENALVFYIEELKKQERRRKDMEIINANAERFGKEAEDNLKFQVTI